ncbi:MAG: tetratricopeptide repeat protein [Verrucomicrobia bacterium]|nr:tetratricopeptide repeat protein [Verrucomicrobiota bacterium]
MREENPAPNKKRYRPTMGPRLHILLYVVFGLFAVLGANSAYLSAITFLEWWNEELYQNYFYQYMFLAHLVLGIILVLPFLAFAFAHLKLAYNRKNRRAVKVGYGLLVISLILLISGFALMRVEGFEIRNPNTRLWLYWAHVITPVLAIWLYVLHRLAGPRIQWKIGAGWAVAVGVAVVAMAGLHQQDPRNWNVEGPKEGEKYFEPSLARTATGNFIPAKTLMMDEYCKRCHEHAYNDWFHSSHHFSSFNNEPYLFSIKELRDLLMERDGDVKASRWCAGCHDVVPFLSGAFDDPNFDMRNHPTVNAGVTCTVCHSITHINSTKGNAAYTIEEPIHYPFAFSDNPFLQKVNELMVKAKPAFHNKTFLKPLHKEAEYCSVCHKVSLPGELTGYKDWLRGQNHYDNFLLSGVSGSNARAFYYPPKAEPNCNDCHMKLETSADFGARFFDESGELKIHDHQFPSSNTALPHLRKAPAWVNEEQEKFHKGNLRVDLFGVKEGGTVDSPLTAPIRPEIPTLKPGQTYLFEVVIRTLKLGHIFTQGTVDSNQVWLEVKVEDDEKVLGHSGSVDEEHRVDPWSHFVNVYMLDKNGNRIDRRNAADIFTPLYNNQIPPGAASVVHYQFKVPENQQQSLKVRVRLNYRKFDTTYMQHVYGQDYSNDLPITIMAEDLVEFPVQGGTAATQNATVPVHPENFPMWQRWNDYGIGLLLKGSAGSDKGELKQAAAAFTQVEALARPEGPVNMARVFFKEGRVDDAARALQRAATFDPPAPRWTVAWFTGQVHAQNGELDEAIQNYRSILEDRYVELDERGFDFSKDYVVINELGQTYYLRSKLERGQPEREKQFLELAIQQFENTLKLDSENQTAHYNLSLIHAELGNEEKAAIHRDLHEKYRFDDNARDRAVAIARAKDPAARHASQGIVIYDLQRTEKE